MYLRRVTATSVGVWRIICVLFLIVSSELRGVRSEFSYESITAVLARINVCYIDPVTKTQRSVNAEIGRFAEGAVGSADGVLVMARIPANVTSRVRLLHLQGCVPNWATPPEGDPWIALLFRGGCADTEKVKLAMAQNASAVLLFGNDQEAYLQKETRFKGNVVVIYLLRSKGDQLANLLANFTKVNISISRGQEVKFRITSINRTSVLFVSVSFIVLMVVSLAWLVFYYVQRFRYINAKDRLARHLNNAAKKALSKIPVKYIKADDKEIEETESCAVCIELYQPGETLRSLPCKHEFHKSCVDPWLLEHRTCPMCKMDILKHYGYVPSGSEGASSRANSTNDADALETGAAHSGREQSLSRRRNIPPGALQISVISSSELAPRPEGTDGGPTSPVTDVRFPSPPPLHQTPSLGTTTAVIRSMILSARPQVTPVTCCSGLPPIHQSPAGERREASYSVKDVGTSYQPPESGTANSSPQSSTPSSPSSSPCSPSFSPTRKPSMGVSDEVITPEDSSVSLSGARNPPSVIDCDIECLVKEIIELEMEEARSERSTLTGVTQGSISPQEGTSRKSSTPSLTPTNGKPLFPPIHQLELPKVDTDPQTQLPLALEGAISSKKPSISFPSVPEERHDSRRRSSSNSAHIDARPSSHLVTISHS